MILNMLKMENASEMKGGLLYYVTTSDMFLSILLHFECICEENEFIFILFCDIKRFAARKQF